MMLMRWQLAYPEQPIPLIGGLLGEHARSGGIMLPEFYNQLGAMHGTIMVFLGVVPLAVGGFGNFVLPLQIGAPDMAFPKLNMASYWSLFLGGVTMFSASSFRAEPRSRAGPPTRRSQHRAHGPDRLADRHGLPDHVVAAGLDQLHRHHHPAARARADLHAAAVLRLGAAWSRRSCCCWPSRRSRPRASCS